MSLVALKNVIMGQSPSSRPSSSRSQRQHLQPQQRQEKDETAIQSGSESSEKQPSSVTAADDGHSTQGSSRTVIDMSTIDLEAQQPATTMIASGGSSSAPGGDEAKNGGSNGKEKGGFRINARVISDATIGLSDGLTVPFALTAGLSALGDTRVVIFGGIAELIAGAISMGLGGYLGAKSEAASYRESVNHTEELVRTDPQAAVNEIRDVFAEYELPATTLEAVTAHLAASPRVVDFLVRFGGEGAGEEPASSRAVTSALTIAAGYFFGGLLPLIPYFCVGQHNLYEGLYISIAVMVVALFTFGYCKTCIVTGWKGSKAAREGIFGGLQMVIIGGAAAGAAMGLVHAFDQIGGS